MAGTIGNTNAKGNSGGKSLQDRKLAAKVRSLALEEVFKILNKGEDHKLYAPVLLKLSGTLLPRLNEHSGPDGDPIPLLGGQSNGYKNTSNGEATETTEEN